MPVNINWDFIKEREGGTQLTGYVPENSDTSGVTAVSGFDLGQQTVESIKNFGITDPALLNTISPYLGLKGEKAKKALETTPLNLTSDQAFSLENSVKNYYQNLVTNQYNTNKKNYSFEMLDPAIQTAIASVGYQYGDLRRTPKFLQAAINNDSEAMVNELRNFDDDFSTRRNLEADYITNNISDATLKKNLRSIADPLSPKEMDGELYMDRVFKTWQYKPEEKPSLGELLYTAADLNFIITNVYRKLTAPTFEPDFSFSLKNNEKEVKKLLDENNISSDYYNYFIDSVSMDHFLSRIDRVKMEQEGRALLHKAGWTGFALDLGSYMLDPVTLLSGYGIVGKMVGAGTHLATVPRLERFVKAGLVVGTEQGILTAGAAVDSPSIDANTVAVAMALGGTLGGGIAAIRKAQLSRVAKDIEHAEIRENGTKLTEKGKRFFSDTNESTTHINDVAVTSIDDVLDPSIVKDKGLIFPWFRNAAMLWLTSLSKSTALGNSKSLLAKAFGFSSLEESIGWVYRGEGKLANRIVAQPDTVEVIRDSYLHWAMNSVSLTVRKSMDDYLKEQGLIGVGGWFKRNFIVPVRADFMQKVTRAIRTFDPLNKNEADRALLNNPHIAKAANAYADAFQKWAVKLKELGIEGSEFNINRGYIPRRMSLERLNQLRAKIGNDGIKDLIVGAILNRQKYMSVAKDAEQRASLNMSELKTKKINKNLPDDQKLGAEWERKIRQEELKKIAGNGSEPDYISPERANLMAEAIIKYISNSRRNTGFDLEALLRIKDPAKLKEFFKESFAHLPDDEVTKLADDLSSVISTLTSGRLTERIKLNESFETTIKGVKVRLDDLYENNVDALFNEYSQEMAGWSALSQRLGIKSRDQWYETSNKIINDIENNYDRTKWLDSHKADEEIKTIQSVFNGMMGRSAEVDPTKPFNRTLAYLRRYNFIRVLGQVGIASLPELGSVISSSGIKVFIQNIPEFGNIMREMKLGKPMQSSFFKELAIINVGNGDEFLYRIAHATETLDQGTAVHAMGMGAKFNNVLSPLEKLTTWSSGLTPVDTILRKLAIRTFADKFADDMIKLKSSNFDFSKVNLNRYKVLGFTTDELKRFANEFSNGAVTTEQTFWGTKVKQFNFANWKDQDLLSTFANRINRHAKRAVQYNFIGDTNRFFGDTAVGKTLGQFRQFVITAWGKQFLHNIALGDFRTFSNFSLTTLLAGMSFMGQTYVNSVGMSDEQKSEYFDKRFGSDPNDWTKVGLAAFQRTGWSSVMPAYADLVSNNLNPNFRFNTRSSGLEINLLTGNPTYDLISTGKSVLDSFMKSAREDYSFSKVDARRIVRLIALQKMMGVENAFNMFIDATGLPEDSKEKLY